MPLRASPHHWHALQAAGGAVVAAWRRAVARRPCDTFRRKTRLRNTWVVLAALGLLSACGGVDPEANNVEVEGGYDLTLRWTPHGIPHVTAKDWGSLGFGVAYVAATDSLCTLARAVLTARGEQARFLGPDEGRRDSDVFHRALLTPDVLARARQGQPAEVEALTRGWVAGYNRYLKDHPADTRPADCKDAAWVRPIDHDDAARLALAAAKGHELGRASTAVLAAAPPAASHSTPPPAATALQPPAAAGTPSAATATGAHADAGLGAGGNAIAFGREATADNRGLLLANAHHPWTGAGRLHAMHLTIPGVLDSMGVAPLTATLVSIGFNRDVAWTHTASAAHGATLHALQLLPGKPTHYRWGAGARALERRAVTVDVLGIDGKTLPHTQVVWMSHLGPVVADAELPWTPAQAWVLRDAALLAERSAHTYLKLNTARSTAEVLAALRTGQGMTWAATVAADRRGDTLYADIGLRPNVDYAFLVRCGVPTISYWRAQRVLALRAEPACEWPMDATAAVPGLMSPARMPVLQRADYVTASDDSHWLAHARQRLEGFPPVLGDEGTARSLRTRASHAAIAALLANGSRVTPMQAQALVTGHQNPLGAALARDVVAACTLEKGEVELANGNPADATRACAALQQWDGTARATSRGALLWAAFWPRASRVDNVWRTPFRIDDALGTPNGLNIDSQPVREGLLRALIEAQDALAGAGVALDAALGTVQYVEDGEQRIPIPGAPADSGAAFSVITSQLDANGRARVRAGNSWVQVVSWDAAGKPRAQAMLAHGQSDDPGSPHRTELTRQYSAGTWLDLPFTEAAIEAAGVERQLHLMDVRE